MSRRLGGKKTLECLLAFVAVFAAGVALSFVVALRPPTAVGRTRTIHATPARDDSPRTKSSESPANVRGDGGWPCLFGPNGDCRAPADVDVTTWSDAGPPQAWRRSLGRGYSAPIIDRGRVFLFHRRDDDEVLTALDLRTGDPLWEQQYSTKFRCRYEYSDGPYSTPRVDGDLIYSVGAEALLHCRTVEDGRLLWSRDLRADFDLQPGGYGFGAQLFVDERHVVLNVGGRQAGVVAFDKWDGRTIWTATDQAMAYTMPRLVHLQNRTFLVVLTDVGLVCLAPNSGEVLDQYPFRSKVGESVTAVTPVVRGQRVLLVGGRGAGAACLDVTTDGRFVEVWRERRALDSLFNTLVPFDDAVFGFTSTRQGAASLRRLEFNSGRVTWDFPSELERGQAVALGDTLVVLGEHGHLATFRVDAPEPRETWRSSAPLLAAPCYTAPSYSQGLLVARNESTVVAWQLAPRRRDLDRRDYSAAKR